MSSDTPSRRPLTYAEAGVDIDSKYRAVRSATEAIERTATPGVMGGIGAFGGLFDLQRAGFVDPVLVSSADGVGTKLSVATEMRRYDTIGRDLVNHCVGDILVQGALPLFFLDYVGVGKMEPEVVREIIAGCARGCQENGLALLGGETAEMPGLYAPGDFDLVGFLVGAVERDGLILGDRVQPGDRLVGLPSAGLHTNGYTLARKIFFERLGLGVHDPVPGLGLGAGEALLLEHRSYLEPVRPFLRDPALHAMSHITGGGLPDNLPRMLPAGVGAVVDRDAWEVPALFRVLVEAGAVPEHDAWRTFNMGIGFVLVVAEDACSRFVDDLRARGENPVVIGSIVRGEERFAFADGRR